ncbi:hypothetical protein P4O66_002117 [Electrophorus voltai]|uniref:K Homology domain-containing protein n=1 Tax=Electrophorus voltai TaxID=2609070 RepID=A0AAD8Z472_9TELE|nr:hypothetical protein P4O66_002117 [Electrophorus voltai]
MTIQVISFSRAAPGETQISRVRKDMYNDTLNVSTEKRSSELPDAVGPIVQLQEKLYVPVKEYPDFNFVGRILGPRGLTAKQLEAETGCKIMVRGKGSMRDKKKEEQNRGKPNWEHLNEDLHVLITVEDAQNRAEVKLKRAVEEVNKLLVPAVECVLFLSGQHFPLSFPFFSMSLDEQEVKFSPIPPEKEEALFVAAAA